jgi:hypothetical protein
MRMGPGSNIDVHEAQRAFAALGACAEPLLAVVRAPLAAEQRPTWWCTLQQAPAVVVSLLENAFADVTLDGGVSLEEAEQIDDYALPARDENSKPPLGYNSEERWQTISLERLECFSWGNFPFQDARGVRLYLPAVLRFDLMGQSPGCLDSLLHTLCAGHQLDSIRRLLTQPQEYAVARYFGYRAMCATNNRKPWVRAVTHAWNHLEADHIAWLAWL